MTFVVQYKCRNNLRALLLPQDDYRLFGDHRINAMLIGGKNGRYGCARKMQNNNVLSFANTGTTYLLAT